MLRQSEESGLSELGDLVKTTKYKNSPLRQCSGCPMLFIDVWGDGKGFCAMYGQQVYRDQLTSPKWCKIVEVTITEKFDQKEEGDKE